MTTTEVSSDSKVKTPVTKKTKATSLSGKESTSVRKKRATKKSGVKKKVKMTVAASNTLSAEERYQKISEAAYFIAERRGFEGGNPEEDWLLAESQIDAEIS